MESPSTWSKPLPTPLSQSALFAVTKYCRLRDLNNKRIISCGSRGWKVQDQGVGEFSSWALFLACRQLPSCCAPTERKKKRKRKEEKEKEKGRERVLVFHHGDSYLVTSFKPNYFTKDPPLNTILLGVRDSTFFFGGGYIYIQFVTPVYSVFTISWDHVR